MSHRNSSHRHAGRGSGASPSEGLPQVGLVRLFDLVMALSTATDMISPAVANHGKRVAYIASSLAREAGLDPDFQHELVLAGVLHDIGALALKERLDLLKFDATNAGSHSELGYLFLVRCPLLAEVASMVRYHHTNWAYGAGAKVAGTAVPLGSHILRLADRLDTAVFRNAHPLGQVDEIVAMITAHRGEMFLPLFVDAFERLAGKEYFWLDIVSPSPDAVLRKVMRTVPATLDQEAVLEFARLIAHIVDFKSSYTSSHTAGVATTAEALARLAGFSDSECRMMLIAGYLHDLGKVSVPSEIIDKPSDLSKDEFGFVRSHTYYTRQILEMIPELATVTDWAASHHERLNGEGYPYHTTGENLSLGARIVAVADVFAALSEDRPYRDGMSTQLVKQSLGQMVESDRLDGRIVELLLRHYEVIERQRRQAQAAESALYHSTLEALRAQA